MNLHVYEAPVTKEEITHAREQLDYAINHFHWVDPMDPLMVDAVIYEYNAAMARYQALIKKIKSQYEQEDNQESKSFEISV